MCAGSLLRFEPRMQVVVFPRSGFAELVDFQRQREPARFKLIGEVLLDRFE